MGTIGVDATLGIRDRLATQRPSVMFVDAPVSGSKGPAGPGQLLILASGPAAAAGWVGPVFGILGRKTVWLGEAGQGSQVKLAARRGRQDISAARLALASGSPPVGPQLPPEMTEPALESWSRQRSGAGAQVARTSGAAGVAGRQAPGYCHLVNALDPGAGAP
jgi:hypothetical protein